MKSYFRVLTVTAIVLSQPALTFSEPGIDSSPGFYWPTLFSGNPPQDTINSCQSNAIILGLSLVSINHPTSIKTISLFQDKERLLRKYIIEKACNDPEVMKPDGDADKYQARLDNCAKGKPPETRRTHWKSALEKMTFHNYTLGQNTFASEDNLREFLSKNTTHNYLDSNILKEPRRIMLASVSRLYNRPFRSGHIIGILDTKDLNNNPASQGTFPILAANPYSLKSYSINSCLSVRPGKHTAITEWITDYSFRKIAGLYYVNCIIPLKGQRYSTKGFASCAL